MLQLSTNLACWPFNFFYLLPLLKDGEWLNCSPRSFDSNHNFTIPMFNLEKGCSKACWPFKHWTFYLGYRTYNGWTSAKIDSNHNIPEFLYSVAIYSLIYCSYVLSGEISLEWSTIQFFDSSSSKKKGHFAWSKLLIVLQGNECNSVG